LKLLSHEREPLSRYLHLVHLNLESEAFYSNHSLNNDSSADGA